MLARISPLAAVLAFTLIAAATASACGSSNGSGPSSFGGSDASSEGGKSDASSGDDGSATSDSSTSDGGMLITGDGSTCTTTFDVEPSATQTITVTIGKNTPTVPFKATLNCQPVSPAWGIEQGNIGTVPATPTPLGTFTPTGTTGGMATVTAGLNGKTLTRQVFVKLTGTQNGPNSSPGETGQIATSTGQLTAGGGVGGVGGEGLGTAVTDPATITALGAPTGNGSAEGLAFLYPYPATVWPRGIVAPLLMWTWAPPSSMAPGDADAILVNLSTTTGSFTWSGMFGKPTIVTMAGGSFIRMPIPQDVWGMATNTAAGKADQLTVSLTVAKGGVGYGPISQTWTVAPARLDGTIYYNSYGTQLVQNYSGAVGGNG